MLLAEAVIVTVLRKTSTPEGSSALNAFGVTSNTLSVLERIGKDPISIVVVLARKKPKRDRPMFGLKCCFIS